MKEQGTKTQAKSQIRAKCVEELKKCVLGGKVNEIETGIYNWTIDYAERNSIVKNWQNLRFIQTYTAKAQSILCNLDSNGYVQNKRFSQRFKDGKFNPKELAFLKPENVFPEIWRSCLDVKHQNNEIVIDQKPESMTDNYKCGKCHKRECIYREVQLRSADEPMSLLITCVNCGARIG